MVALQYGQTAEKTGIREVALRPILRPGEFFWLAVAGLSVLILWGLVSYLYQLKNGLAVTGLNQQVTWGFYITDMVFFIGVSYGGAMTSAILRLTNAPWRAPLSRIAETMAVASLMVGGVFPIIDLGRPDRVYYLLLHGQVGSPVVWDVVAIQTYMVAGLVFLYLPMIPDIAVCRDRLGPAASSLQRALYTRLALGWQGTPGQRHILEWGTTVTAIIIIPLAVSVHSVLAWLFGVTSRPGWDSTIFAPYFVVGAMFSGVATVILIVAFFRWAYHLEEYIEKKHFVYLSYILVTLALGYTYFLFSEYLTEGYKMHEPGGALLELLLTGRLAPFFWLFSIGGLIVPILLIAIPYTRTIPGITVASLAVVLGMWLKRFLIVVPGLAEPQIASDVTIYWPTMVEVSITVAAAAAIPLMMLLFFRVFPIISIYEVEEAAEAEAGHHTEMPLVAEAE
jgi:molybdopterin-containing oxidoreductase family membrane subunit